MAGTHGFHAFPRHSFGAVASRLKAAFIKKLLSDATSGVVNGGKTITNGNLPKASEKV
jgi:hypothetical protein